MKQHRQAEICSLQIDVIDKLNTSKENSHHITRSNKHNHNLVAVYCEKKMTEEILTKYIMPDGTSRQGVGDIAATLVKTGYKFRALKIAQ